MLMAHAMTEDVHLRDRERFSRWAVGWTLLQIHLTKRCPTLTKHPARNGAPRKDELDHIVNFDRSSTNEAKPLTIQRCPCSPGPSLPRAGFLPDLVPFRLLQRDQPCPSLLVR
jgi:hypothetical protein